MPIPANFEETALQRFIDAKSFSDAWRTQARDDYAFVSGDQWESDDEAILDEQNRPKVTFNYSEKMIDAVVGAEISNRQEVKYFPREVSDAALSELWSNVAKWARDQCDAEDEETDGFRDALICGMGWCETYLSYDYDLDGMIIVCRVDPLEMYWDPASVKHGLADRRYDFRVLWVDEAEIARKYPGQIITGQDVEGGGRGVDTITHGHRYIDDVNDREDVHKGQVQILQYECWYKGNVYRVNDPETGQIIEVAEDTFLQQRQAIEHYGIQYIKQEKKIFYQAVFAGDTMLEVKVSPTQCGFTRNCITGKRDRNKNTWYGLTRVMKDPQRWANKWLSQIMHIINSNAKGGILAETGAFADPRKAQEEWAKTDSVTLLKEGGLNKIKEKSLGNYPAGIDRLMEFALNSLPQVTGINLEALGLANREQAGVLEASRKQAAYGILAPMFDGLRLYRKMAGRVLLYFIQEYIADGRLVRIVGQDGAQVIPLTKDKQAITYDIIVDQAPDSPDSKAKTWETLQNILPAMLKAGVPLPPMIFDYTPLPASLAQQWKQYAIENKNTPSPEQIKQFQQKMQQLTEENQKMKMDKSAEMADFQMKGNIAQADHAMEVEKMNREFQLKQIEMEREFALDIKKLEMEYQIKMAGFAQEAEIKAFEAERCAAMDSAKMNEEISRKREQMNGDLKIKAMQAGITPDDENKELSLKLDVSDLSDAMDAIAETNKQAVHANESMQEAILAMTKQLAAPKEVVFKDGRPVGIRPKD